MEWNEPVPNVPVKFERCKEARSIHYDMMMKSLWKLFVEKFKSEFYEFFWNFTRFAVFSWNLMRFAQQYPWFKLFHNFCLDENHVPYLFSTVIVCLRSFSFFLFFILLVKKDFLLVFIRRIKYGILARTHIFDSFSLALSKFDGLV